MLGHNIPYGKIATALTVTVGLGTAAYFALSYSGQEYNINYDAAVNFYNQTCGQLSPTFSGFFSCPINYVQTLNCTDAASAICQSFTYGSVTSFFGGISAAATAVTGVSGVCLIKSACDSNSDVEQGSDNNANPTENTRLVPNKIDKRSCWESTSVFFASKTAFLREEPANVINSVDSPPHDLQM